MNQFAESLKNLRLEKKISMQILADQSGVSKSMISKIERGEVQPTIDIAARLAKALGKTLSELLHTAQTKEIIFMAKNEQPVWEDAHGIKRRNISPIFDGLKVDWIEVTLPAATSIQKCVPLNTIGGDKFILMKEGKLKIVIDNKFFLLETGDSLYFEANCSHEFHNETNQMIKYYVVIKYIEK